MVRAPDIDPHAYNLACGLPNSTLLTMVPTPSRVTSQISLSFNHTGGFLPAPTPDGLRKIVNYNKSDTMSQAGRTHVPVKIRSPGSSVVPWLKNEIVLATPKIISAVFES